VKHLHKQHLRVYGTRRIGGICQASRRVSLLNVEQAAMRPSASRPWVL
jgi:hypothetical protein